MRRRGVDSERTRCQFRTVNSWGGGERCGAGSISQHTTRWRSARWRDLSGLGRVSLAAHPARSLLPPRLHATQRVAQPRLQQRSCDLCPPVQICRRHAPDPGRRSEVARQRRTAWHHRRAAYDKQNAVASASLRAAAMTVVPACQVFADDPTYGNVGVAQVVGQGRIFAWGDGWVTYNRAGAISQGHS